MSLKEELINLEKKGLLRKLPLLEGSQSSKVTIDGKSVLNLCSNNYLGLADDERLKQAASRAIAKYGLGSGASRLVCGNMLLHQELEGKIAKFKKSQKALLFSTGYMANLGIISSLVGKDDIVFSDRLNHASIIDGIILSRASLKRYHHKDTKNLERLLEDAQDFKKKLIITDTVFSMDGDIAPLPEIIRLAKKYNALVMVDEAHATGLLGKNGAGVVEYFGLEGQIDIQMGTLSKAVGTFGAYCCGSSDLIDYLINQARSFIYTTAMPVGICASSIKAIQIIQDEPGLREKLLNNAEYLRRNLKGLGFNTLDSQTPIIPILVKDTFLTMKFSQELFNEGIFVQGIRPPTVSQNTARLRVTVMAMHSRADLDFVIDKFKKIGEQLCLI